MKWGLYIGKVIFSVHSTHSIHYHFFFFNFNFYWRHLFGKNRFIGLIYWSVVGFVFEILECFVFILFCFNQFLLFFISAFLSLVFSLVLLGMLFFFFFSKKNFTQEKGRGQYYSNRWRLSELWTLLSFYLIGIRTGIPSLFF